MVVAILTALLSLGFVALMQVRTSMLQMELDVTARELYVAAQNHLAAADSQGLLFDKQGKSRVQLGVPESGAESGADNHDAVYYFVYNPDVPGSDSSNPSNKASALSLMLPFGSIDETVRTGGSYVVRYQPSTATVLDVFFAKPNGSSTGNFGAYEFKLDDYPVLVDPDDPEGKYRGESQASNRRDYKGTGAVIGWYGGEQPGKTPQQLDAPNIEVENGDTLTVKVTNRSSWSDDLKQHLKVFVNGEQSHSVAVFDISLDPTLVNWGSYVNSPASGEYVVTLDDVTSEAGRFAEVMAAKAESGELTLGEGASADLPFVPGEDLSIYAEIVATEGLATVARSVTVTANSLFADDRQGQTQTRTQGAPAEGGLDEGSGVGVQAAPGALSVRVASFRHLENLDPAVSQFNVAGAAVQAVQVTDLSWPSFLGNVGLASQVYAGKAGSAEKSDEGTAWPVSPAYRLDYDGAAHEVEDVTVSTTDADAGLFGSLVAGSRVANVELVDFDIVSTGANAGALAGSVAGGTEITNVLAREHLTDASDARVVGATAGGLVGWANAAGGAAVTIAQSAAALYVQGTTGAAGGLVGSAAGALSLAECYAGGHTAGGMYNPVVADLSSESTGRANTAMNVVSRQAQAGGLVGSASTLTAEYSYSTCSAWGAVQAGGFVGAALGGSITNCYATGLVAGADGAATGAFAGLLGAGVSDCHYLSAVNATGFDADTPALKAVGVLDPPGITPIDESVRTYADFVPAVGDMAAANPYDDELPTDSSADNSLIARYQHSGKAVYPYRTIRGKGNSLTGLAAPEGADAVNGVASGLSPQSAVVPFDESQQPASVLSAQAAQAEGASSSLITHLATHYGDWPSPEALVRNARDASVVSTRGAAPASTWRAEARARQVTAPLDDNARKAQAVSDAAAAAQAEADRAAASADKHDGEGPEGAAESEERVAEVESSQANVDGAPAGTTQAPQPADALSEASAATVTPGDQATSSASAETASDTTGTSGQEGGTAAPLYNASSDGDEAEAGEGIADANADHEGEESADEADTGFEGERTIKRTVKTAEGNTYTVALTYDADAALPEDTVLSVVELVPRPADYDPDDPKYKGRPYATERFVGSKALGKRVDAATEALQLRDDDQVFFTKFLDISLTSDGAAVQPQAPVQLTVQTNDLAESSSDSIEGALRTAEGAYDYLAAENETRKGKGVQLTFTADRIAELALIGVVTPALVNDARPLTSDQVEDAQSQVGSSLQMQAAESDAALQASVVAVQAFADDVVCKIGETGYATVQDAVDQAPAGQASVIELLKDVDLAATLQLAAANADGKSITLTTAPEYSGSGSVATIGRAADFADAPLIGLSEASARLTLANVVVDGRGIEVSANGALVQAASGTVVVGEGAVLQNGASSGDGGAIWMGDGTQLEVSGMLTGCSAGGRGGAVYAGLRTSVNIAEGAQLVQNAAAKHGGAVYIGGYAASSTLTISGAALSGNSAAWDGGAVKALDTVVTVTDSTVSDNKASGLDVLGDTSEYVQNGGAFDVRGGSLTLLGSTSIASCEAGHDGGAVYTTGNVKVSGHVVIDSCTATLDGGAVCISNEGVSASFDGCTISNCRASSNSGGAIFGWVKTLDMANCLVRNCYAANYGGGVCVNYYAAVTTLTTCTFKENEAGNAGGAAWIWRLSRLSLAGGTYANNKATYGGVLALEPGAQATLTDSPTVTGNGAVRGGALWINGSPDDPSVSERCATVTLTSGQFKSNTALHKGGAIYVADGSALNMSGGTLSDNGSAFGGAIDVGGARARLAFSGNPTVLGNTGKKNVYLDADSNFVISANGLGAEAKIGVYVADSLVTTHGSATNPFGTYVSDPNLDKFINDRNGMTGAAGDQNNQIIWKGQSFTVFKEWRNVSNYDDYEISFELHRVTGGASYVIGSGNTEPPANLQTAADVTISGNQFTSVKPNPNGFFLYDGRWFYQSADVISQDKSQYENNAIIQPHRLAVFTGRILDETYYAWPSDNQGQIDIIPHGDITQFLMGDIIICEGKMWLLTAEGYQTRRDFPKNYTGSLQPGATRGNFTLLGDAASSGGDSSKVTISYESQEEAEGEQEAIESAGFTVEPYTQGADENGRYTISAEDDWSRVFTGLDEGEYYAVEVQIRNVKVPDAEIPAFVPTYDSREIQSGRSVSIINTAAPDGTVEVGFTKIDGFGQPVQGARFALYDADNVPVAAKGDEQHVVGGQAVSDENGRVVFTVPVGVYYMREANVPADSLADNTATWYVLAAGAKYMDASALPADVFADISQDQLDAQNQAQRNVADMASIDKNYAIFRLEQGRAQANDGEGEGEGGITVWGLMNSQKLMRKVVLKKTDVNASEPLSGAEFQMYTADWAPLANEDPMQTASDDPDGFFFVGDLAYGTYYLKETKAPEGYADGNEGKAFVLTVGEDSVDEFGAVVRGVTVIGPQDAADLQIGRVVETGGGGTTDPASQASYRVRLADSFVIGQQGAVAVLERTQDGQTADFSDGVSWRILGTGASIGYDGSLQFTAEGDVLVLAIVNGEPVASAPVHISAPKSVTVSGSQLTVDEGQPISLDDVHVYFGDDDVTNVATLAVYRDADRSGAATATPSANNTVTISEPGEYYVLGCYDGVWSNTTGTYVKLTVRQLQVTISGNPTWYAGERTYLQHVEVKFGATIVTSSSTFAIYPNQDGTGTPVRLDQNGYATIDQPGTYWIFATYDGRTSAEGAPLTVVEPSVTVSGSASGTAGSDISLAGISVAYGSTDVSSGATLQVYDNAGGTGTPAATVTGTGSSVSLPEAGTYYVFATYQGKRSAQGATVTVASAASGPLQIAGSNVSGETNTQISIPVTGVSYEGSDVWWMSALAIFSDIAHSNEVGSLDLWNPSFKTSQVGTYYVFASYNGMWSSNYIQVEVVAPSLGVPVVGQGCTATQASITAASWGANSFTWQQSDGGFVYGLCSDDSIAVVYYQGEYYVPYSWGNKTRVSQSYLFANYAGFSLGHLTDGQSHTYGTDQYNTVPVSWQRAEL